MALSRLHKALSIEVRLDDVGVWQCEVTHRLEHMNLGSYIEAGASPLHSGREIQEAVAAAIERWSAQPWSLEMQNAPQGD